jgi:caffeoyl-CoA O-methyltransferase
MSEFFSPESLKYLEENCEPESLLLKDLSRETYLTRLKPRMLSGHNQGRFLSMMSHILKPKRILEIGTFTGYSTLCLAEGLLLDGKIITLESNLESLLLARKYFSLSNYKNQIEVWEGNALQSLENLKEIFDLVFIDADKENNQAYFDLIFPWLRPNGVILVDNVLWNGKIVAGETDKKTNRIREFNAYIQSRKDLQSMILPVRDGILWIRKI